MAPDSRASDLSGSKTDSESAENMLRGHDFRAGGQLAGSLQSL